MAAIGPVAAEGWEATLYGGPATSQSSSQIFFEGRFHADDSMVGLALGHPVWRWNDHLGLYGEGQVTRFTGSRNYATASLGLGLRYDGKFWDAPASLALYTGPSYADHPPLISMGSFHGAPIDFGRKKFLEYVGAEFAISISKDHLWSGVLRFYHRSGAFGLWADNADEGSMIGLGIRRAF